jgi:mRNA interferase MazF
VFNEHSGTVIAVAITSEAPKADFPLTLELTDTRLAKHSWARISQVRTLSTERITSKLCSASPAEVEQVVEGLKELLGG